MNHLSRAQVLRLALAGLGAGVLPAGASPALAASRTAAADPTTPTAALGALRASCPGRVLLPGTPAYTAEVAGFQTAVTAAPALVVRAVRPADVAAAVVFARATGRRVSVQATGHGLDSDLRGTVLVSTRALTGVRVDAVARTATVGAGVRWREVMDAAAAYGLAPLVGSSSAVGAVGYSLGGGTGLLSRQYGWAADQVRRLQVVTGEGRLRTADACNERALFQALRGGKFGLGVVTSATVGLVPVTRLRGGTLFYPGESAGAVLRAWRTWAPTLPREAATSVALQNLPPLPQLPEPLRGKSVVALRWSHTGDPAAADALLAPARGWAPLLLDTVGELPWTAMDAVHGDPTDPTPSTHRGTGLRELTTEAVDALVAAAGPGSGSPLASVELRLMGGALAGPPRVPDMVLGRGAAFSLFALGVLAGPAAGQVPAALDRVMGAASPWSCPGPLNLADPGRHDDLRSPAQRRDLDRVRRSVDPDGIFR
ncbi:FAD-binding oxidoreductase [Kineococcus gynurae]|uniref:FAD-binding oxidoreductase n=1 Tax=Kineococcus gynurae TaxID=452979 RepID=A0ABV5LTQ1_9ACTN